MAAVNGAAKLLVIAAALSIAVAAALASASVLVYYPLTLNVQYAQPPVVFNAGPNANQPDLSGSIDVTIGANKTSATITIHPTYQITEYRDILYVNNTGTTTYYVWIVVENPPTPPNTNAYLHIIINGQDQGDLFTSGTIGPITLDGGKGLVIGFKSYLPEGTPLPSSALSFTLKLVYSQTQNVTP